MGSSGGGAAAAAAARMDPEAAMELARKGVTLLLLDVPQHTVLGVDTQVFSVGPRFRGMKMVPPGPHFLHYCSPSRHGNEFAPTVGFFLTTHPSEVVVRRWHAQEERLVTLSEEEEIRYSEAVKRFEFDDQLGPYNLDSFGDWKQLSSYLSQSVIERLEPIGGEITIALETSWMDRAPQTEMERRLIEQLREDKFAKKAPAQPERRGCYYTTIPASVKHKNISADELTLLNLDREILRIYPALLPPTLTLAASTRVCNVLALFQCIASYPGTRSPFIKADIPSYLYPFLRTVDKAQPFECLRLTTLGVIGALVKDEKNTEATVYLLKSETIPLCLKIMEIGNEPSKTVSTFIILKVLLNDLGLHHCCDTHGPFYKIAFALQVMVSSPDDRPSARLLKCIIRCYLRLFDHPRGRAVLKTRLPSVLQDGTFNDYLMADPSAQECLQQLLATFHRCNDDAIVP